MSVLGDWWYGPTDRRRPAGKGRWVVVDVESSGLDATRDRLIAVGAIAVTDGIVDPADAFEAVLRQGAPSAAANIEVHGIGGQEQLSGEPAAQALGAFLAFCGADPLVAWHASFDATLLRRSIRGHLGRRWRAPWIDLAALVPLAWPGRAPGRALDDWLAAFEVPVFDRHRAIVDCLATAQLLAAFLPQAARLGAATSGELAALSSGGQWLGGAGFAYPSAEGANRPGHGGRPR